MLLIFRDKKHVYSRINADFQAKTVSVENETTNPVFCAFGIKKKPTWQDFLNFLESRCFPRSRDHMDACLQALGLAAYEPLEIIKKTGGHMSEDDCYLEISGD